MDWTLFCGMQSACYVQVPTLEPGLRLSHVGMLPAGDHQLRACQIISPTAFAKMRMAAQVRQMPLHQLGHSYSEDLSRSKSCLHKPSMISPILCSVLKLRLQYNVQIVQISLLDTWQPACKRIPTCNVQSLHLTWPLVVNNNIAGNGIQLIFSSRICRSPSF